MKFAALTAALLLTIAGNVAATEPSDAELGDWTIYLKSIGLPATVELCGAVLKDDGKLKVAGDSWLVANKDAIERGRTLAAANPPKDKTVEQYNRALVADFREQFGKQPDDFKRDWCKNFATALDTKAK